MKKQKPGYFDHCEDLLGMNAKETGLVAIMIAGFVGLFLWLTGKKID